MVGFSKSPESYSIINLWHIGLETILQRFRNILIIKSER